MFACGASVVDWPALDRAERSILRRPRCVDGRRRRRCAGRQLQACGVKLDELPAELLP